LIVQRQRATIARFKVQVSSETNSWLPSRFRVNNFLPVTIDLRVYINKRKAFSKNLEDSTRHTFDLAHVEDAFNDSIEPLIGDEDYRIIPITASVKLFSGRGRARVQDITDFSVPASASASQEFVRL
jgi:hypothetical protein